MGYPIKFAVEELKVNGGSAYNYEDITKGYIVSKCYVLEDRLCYSSSDDMIQKFVVSFPYDRFDDFIKWYDNNSEYYYYDIYKHYNEQKRNPDNEYLRDEYPCHIVTQLFDTYYEAKEVADINNSHLKSEKLATANSVLYEKLIKNFEEDILMFGEYEKFIYVNTTDMEISLNSPRYVYSKDSENINQLLEKFEYNSENTSEVISKYTIIQSEFQNREPSRKNLTIPEDGGHVRKLIKRTEDTNYI